MTQGLSAPSLAVGEAATTKRQNADDYDAVSSSAAGLTWEMNKWNQALHWKQLQAYLGSEPCLWNFQS